MSSLVVTSFNIVRHTVRCPQPLCENTFPFSHTPSCSHETRRSIRNGHGAGGCGELEQHIYHSNHKFTCQQHHKCLHPSCPLLSQTSIWPSQHGSKGIKKKKKINWVVFPFNLCCMFSLSTGVPLGKSVACQLHIHGEQIDQFPGAGFAFGCLWCTRAIAKAYLFWSFHSLKWGHWVVDPFI